MADIRIGTSGFSYDDWKGFFYPASIRKGDMLAYYAERFRTVEVNSTYYAIPSPSTFERMSGTTPDGFEFVVKAHKDLTHAAHADVETFKRLIYAISPIVENGKLGCILAQYPWSFRKQKSSAARLRQLREEFGDLPVVVEFRNAGWVGEDTSEFLRKLELGFCCVDEPALNGLMPRVVYATSRIGYIRFHGRNSEKWWHHDEPWQRYDYLYTADELKEWMPKVRSLETACDKVYVFFNNHYQGKSAENARLFAQMLGASAAESGK